MMNKRKNSKNFETKMDMTPLIDCVFLLIMFFILTTEITVQLEDVTLPYGLEGKQQVEGQNETLLVVNVILKNKDGGDPREGEILFNADKHDLESLTRILKEEARLDPRARERRSSGQPLSQLELLIRADKDVHSVYLRTIFTACSQAGIYKIKLSSVPPGKDDV